MKPVAAIAETPDRRPDTPSKLPRGRRAVFPNPGNALPNGIHFVTASERDGGSDRASDIDRDNVRRLKFGPRPPRAPKGGVANAGRDFAAPRPPTPRPAHGWMGRAFRTRVRGDRPTPRPTHGWMGWVVIPGPDRAAFGAPPPLLDATHDEVRATAERLAQ